MDQETAQTNENENLWGAESNEQSTFGSSTNDADSKYIRTMKLVFCFSLVSQRSIPSIRCLGRRARCKRMGSNERESGTRLRNQPAS